MMPVTAFREMLAPCLPGILSVPLENDAVGFCVTFERCIHS